MEQSFVLKKEFHTNLIIISPVSQNSLRELGEPNDKFQDYLKDPNTHSQFFSSGNNTS